MKHKSYREASGLSVVPLYYSIPLLIVCISAFLILIFLFNVEIPQVMLSVPANAINVSSCGTLNQNNAYYLLNASLTFTNSPCIQITGSNITFDGQSNVIRGNNVNGAAALYASFGSNITVRMVNITSAFTAIYLNSARNSSVVSNNINGSVVAVRLEVSPQTRVGQNQITNTSAGIQVMSSSDYSLIEQNTIISGVGSYGSGIGLSNVNYSTVRQNIISNFFNAIKIWESWGGNTIINNTLSNSAGSSVLIDLPDNGNVVLQRNNVFNTNTSYYDLEIVPSSDNNVGFAELIDNSFGSYKINSTFVTFVNSGNSRINFTQQLMNVNGSNLNNDVRLGFNYASVDSILRSSLNKSAVITFYGLPTNITNSTILRDGALCPVNLCTNLTSLSAGTVIFNVTSWTNYSIDIGNYSAGNGTIGNTPNNSLNSIMSINEPDSGDLYTVLDFPVVFDVNLSINGTVKFSLNNGVTNNTMNTTDSRLFNYNQSLLAIGNYTFTAYANLTNGTRLSDSVNFRVVDITPTIEIN